MKYGKELKEQYVHRILNKESTIKKTAEELEVHYTTVRLARQYQCDRLEHRVLTSYYWSLTHYYDNHSKFHKEDHTHE